MNVPSLSPDCGRCAALCCVLLAFEAGPCFGYDKPAGEACRHLGTDCRCAIHAARTEQGFSGCAAYDCLGAGQRVTALLKGRDATVSEYSSVFAAALRQHEMLALLAASWTLPLPHPARLACTMWRRRLLALDLGTASGRRRLLDGSLKSELARFLASLAEPTMRWWGAEDLRRLGLSARRPASDR